MGNGWLAPVILLMAVSFLGTLGFRVLVPAVAFLVSEDIGAGVAGAALASASFIAARGLVSLLSGWLYDRVKSARLLPAAGFALFSGLSLLFALAKSPLDVALLKAAQGVLSGVSWPLVQVALALSVPDRVRGRALSIYFGVGSLAGFLANVVYAAVSKWPLSSQLALPAVLYLLAAVAYAASGAAPQPSRKKKGRVTPQLAVVAAAFAVSLLSSFSFGEVSYALLASILSLSRAETAVFMAFVTGIGVAVSYALNWIADLGYEARVLCAVTAAVALAPLALAAGGLLTLAGYAVAVAAQASFRPLTRRYLASRSGSPGLAIGAVNAASNLGTLAGQVAVAFLSL